MNSASAAPAVPIERGYPALSVQVRIVALMFALSAMSYFDRVVMSIAWPGIMRDFGISETRMGWIFSAALFEYMLFVGPDGTLADRFCGCMVLAMSVLGVS